MAMRRVVLVDGSALILRAWFAIPGNLRTASGLHTNAILGFATMFRKMFAGKRPELGAVVFDSPVKTFREERWSSYKANRPSLPPDLSEQLAWIPKLVDANRFPRLRVDRYEADDVIATLAREAVEAGHEVVIVSSDKDFAQLIGDRVRMHDTLRDLVYDAELVRKKWGVPPAQMRDLLALMGDDSDNLPGVHGIGAKGAAALLGKYGSLEGIYAHLPELTPRQRTALEEGRANALLSQELATLDSHAALPVKLADLAIGEPDPAELNRLYRELELFSLLGEEDRGGAPSTVETVLCESEESCRAAIASLSGRVAVVPLFDGPRAEPILAGLALAEEPGKAVYLAKPLLAKAWLEDESRRKVVHDAKELWMVLRRAGISLRGAVLDTMLASYLAEPTRSIPHRLDQIAREYLHRTIRPRKALTGAGQKERRLAEIAPAEIAPWAGELAAAAIEAAPKLEERLAALGLDGLHRELELPLAFVLGRMELDGVQVSGPELAAAGAEFARTRDAEARRAWELAGHEFNIASTKQLGTVLFDELKLPVLRRTKTGYATDSDVLERLAPRSEILRHVLEFRKYEKLINTYTDVLQAAINPRTGRVHATFQQTASASGRLIATDPDLQRTPIRTPEGKRIRKAFLAGAGNVILSADWSQIELRVLAHLSGDAALVSAFRDGIDVHRRTAGELFHVAPEAVTPEQRGAGKTVNFATIYGQGATALAQILGVPRIEAAAYIDRYFEVYAGVRSWLDRTIAEAHENGYVTTIAGRRRWIPELASNNPVQEQAGERIAANTPIQGSAADLCKMAMLGIARELESSGMKTRMLVQIHDELLFEAPAGEAEVAKALVRRVMEKPMPLSVPLVVEIGAGPTWADAH